MPEVLVDFRFFLTVFLELDYGLEKTCPVIQNENRKKKKSQYIKLKCDPLR